MKKYSKIKIITVILVLLLTLSACSGNGGTATTTAPGTTPEYKDTLIIATTAQPPTLDGSLTASQVSLTIAGNIFEQLYTMNKDYEPTPDLAESYTVSDDGLVYTFKLREGVKFHNGKEMTADDVVASMNRWLEVSARGKTLLGGTVFAKVDDYNVTMTVPKVTSDIMTIIATRTFFPVIMPKEVIESATAEGVKEYIGTGPYKLQEWKQDQYIHLVKYDEYTTIPGESSAYSGLKSAATPNLFFYFVQDHSTRIAGMKTGEYDIIENVPLENYDELNTADGVVLFSKPSGSLNAFFNTQQGVLADVKMRQAVMAALSMDEIMLASYADTAHFTLDPGYMNLNQPQWAVKTGSEFYNQKNTDKAKQLMAEAGYAGETINLLTTPDYQEMYTATLVVQEQLRQAGFTVEVISQDFPSFMSTKGDFGRWNIFITSNGYNIIPPMILAVNSSWAGFDAPEVALGLKAIREAGSNEEAQQAWADLQQFMYEYGSSTAIGHYKTSMATRDSVDGFVFFDLPIYWNAVVAK
jgi:peptide/nickel transport system substrate-binding protein